MAQHVKLTEAGSSIVRKIQAVTTNENGKWPDYELHAEGGLEIIVIPKTAADRQLTRAGVTTAQELVGSWVKVSRSDKAGDNGKLFWNLAIVPPQTESAPSKRIPPPPRKALPFDEESFPPASETYAVAPQDHMPVRQGNMPDLSDEPVWTGGFDGDDPPMPANEAAFRVEDAARKAPAKPSSVAPKAEAKAAYINAYFDLLGYVKAHSGLKDEVALQACAATLHIGLKQEGLR